MTAKWIVSCSVPLAPQRVSIQHDCKVESIVLGVTGPVSLAPRRVSIQHDCKVESIVLGVTGPVSLAPQRVSIQHDCKVEYVGATGLRCAWSVLRPPGPLPPW